ncbi:MAG: hypothetical protein L0Y38_02685 [Methylococcaceae bacterium]|nr:hypothetical protein [Methylococcaceae bacterium]
METNPAPDAIFGSQGLTPEDQEYRGSRFGEVKAAIFANPYQKVWGDPREPALPFYKTTNRSVYAGTLPGGKPPQFKLASIRALDSGADLRFGGDGRGFRRLVRPAGVCVTGRWEIDQDNPYSGYFRNGSRGLVIARISAGVTMTLRGIRRSFGMALKLYPTPDENHTELLRTANVLLADDLGGSTARRLTEVDLSNAPRIRGFNRGTEIPVLLNEGAVFEIVDRMGTMRQVYPIAELGIDEGTATKAPEYMRLRTSAGQAANDEDDVRNQVLAQLYDKGNSTPQRTLSFDISVSDRGKQSGFPFFPGGLQQTVSDWQTIGKVTFTDGVASYNGDFVVHFRHPTWRKDKNDPASAFRIGGRKVRWF